MTSLTISNHSSQITYAYPSVRPGYKIVDYVIDIVGLLDGFTEVKEALAGTEELAKLPEAIESFSDFMKYVKYLWNAKNKINELKESARETILKVYEDVRGLAIPVLSNDTKDIMNTEQLGHLNPAGIAELLRLRVVNVTLTNEQNGMVQVQSSVDTNWDIYDLYVLEKGSQHEYYFHGAETSIPITKWRPAMISGDNCCYLVAKGKGDTVWYSVYKNKSWSVPIHIPGIHPEEGVSLCTDFRIITAIWKQAQTGQTLFSRYDEQEQIWTTPKIINAELLTNHAPSITSFNGQVSIGVTYNSNLIGHSANHDLSRYYGQRIIQSNNISSTSVAVINTYVRTDAYKSSRIIYYFWLDPRDYSINICGESEDKNYVLSSRKLASDAFSLDTPSVLQIGDGKVRVFFRGKNDENIYYYSFDIEKNAIKVSPKIQVPNASSAHGPAISAEGWNFVLTYRDKQAQHVIWTMRLSGKTWSKPMQIS